MIALGFALIYGTTRTFHFAHGAVYVLSAYFFFSLSQLSGWNSVIVFLVTLVFAGLSGILIDKLLYLPLIKRGSSLTVQLLSSLAFYIVVVNLIAVFYGTDTKVLRSGVQPSFSFGSIILTEIQIKTLFSFLAVFVALWVALRHTTLGKIIRAMRDDPDLVSAIGIDPLRYRLIVFSVGSMLAGWGAVLRGIDVGIEPDAGMTSTLTGAVAVIIGGVGIFEAAAFGALLLGILQGAAVWGFSSQWQDTVTFLVLIIFLLFRPQGMFSYRRRIEEVVR